MSIHPSLASSSKDKKQKTVLKRIERIKYMMEKGLWKDDTSIFGLPKIKMVRVKVKKEKAAKEETAAITSEAAATPETTATPTLAAGATAATKTQAKSPPAGKK